MQMSGYPGQTSFGLLPEPEGRSASFVTSATVNAVIVGLMIWVGMTAKHVLQQRHFEQTELIFPTTPPPAPKFKTPPPPKLPDLPKPKLEVQMEQPKIKMPKIEPKPALKPLEMEAKLNTPEIKVVKPSIILAPQPKAALTAAMPAEQHCEGIDRPCTSGRDVWRDSESECKSTCNCGCDREPLWRYARTCNSATRRGRVGGDRQRTEIRIERRHGR